MIHDATDPRAGNEAIGATGAEGAETGSGQQLPTSTGAAGKFIVFVLGADQYAIDSHTVSEVVRDLNPTPLPNLPEWLTGIANLRGEIVTVFDLQKLLGITTKSIPRSKKHIVLTDGSPDVLIAFSVDKLREIVTVNSSAVESPEKNENPFVAGRIRHKSYVLNVLDPARMLAALKLE